MDISQWRCGSCGTSPANLLVLPQCEHTFCMVCVDLWLWTYISEYGGQSRRYPCQRCGITYQIPVNGLEAFTQNIHILQLDARLQNLNMAVEGVDNSTVDTSVSSPANISPSMASHMVMDIVSGNLATVDNNLRTDTATASMETGEATNIMSNSQAACNTDFLSIPPARCAMLPNTGYCSLPNHMF